MAGLENKPPFVKSLFEHWVVYESRHDQFNTGLKNFSSLSLSKQAAQTFRMEPKKSKSSTWYKILCVIVSSVLMTNDNVYRENKLPEIQRLMDVMFKYAKKNDKEMETYAPWFQEMEEGKKNNLLNISKWLNYKKSEKKRKRSGDDDVKPHKKQRFVDDQIEIFSQGMASKIEEMTEKISSKEEIKRQYERLKNKLIDQYTENIENVEKTFSRKFHAEVAMITKQMAEISQSEGIKKLSQENEYLKEQIKHRDQKMKGILAEQNEIYTPQIQELKQQNIALEKEKNDILLKAEKQKSLYRERIEKAIFRTQHSEKVNKELEFQLLQIDSEKKASEMEQEKLRETIRNLEKELKSQQQEVMKRNQALHSKTAQLGIQAKEVQKLRTVIETRQEKSSVDESMIEVLEKLNVKLKGDLNELKFSLSQKEEQHTRLVEKTNQVFGTNKSGKAFVKFRAFGSNPLNIPNLNL